MNHSDLPAVPMPTILIVDDSLSYLGALLDRLERHGFLVVLAQSAAEGLMRAEFAEPDLIEHWRERLPKAEFRIGISWQGNPKFKQDKTRSIPLAEFVPLADVPGIRLIALQKDHGAEQIAAAKERLLLEARLGGSEASVSGQHSHRDHAKPRNGSAGVPKG